jgi:cbb3-type cytochrome oxidase subunit 3
LFLRGIELDIEFSSGVVLKVIEHHFSETDVSGSPFFSGGGTYISTESKHVCNTDVWISINGKDKCISITQPFKALDGHSVTVSYETSTGKLIQIKNDSIGHSTWASLEMKERYRASPFNAKRIDMGDMIGANAKRDRLFKKALSDSLPVLGVMLLITLLISLLHLGIFFRAMFALAYCAIVFRQWKKSTVNYTVPITKSYPIYLPMAIVPLFIVGKVSFVICAIGVVVLMYFSKKMERDEAGEMQSRLAPKEKEKTYDELKQEHYSSMVDS